MTKAIASEFTGVMTGTKLNISDIETDIIETVRNNDPFGEAGEIVIVGLQFFQSVEMSVSVEIAQILLLFRIHTDDWIASCLIFGDQSNNILKLRIAVGHLLHGAFLLSFPTPVVVLFE